MAEMSEVRRILRDGKPVVQFHCPGCGLWGDVDDDQYHGRVSMDCPQCSFHETIDLSSEGPCLP